MSYASLSQLLNTWQFEACKTLKKNMINKFYNLQVRGVLYLLQNKSS